MACRTIFATLGPAGSNHEYVTKRYLTLHELTDVEVVLVEDFALTLGMMSAGEVDFTVQVAVHPDVTNMVAKAHFEHGIHVVDAFVSPSRPLGVLTRAEVSVPKSLGLHSATEAYLDTSRWDRLVPEVSRMTVSEGLLEGRFDSGVTALSFVEGYPERFRIEEELGTVDDPWIVYGRERVSDGRVVAWRDGPIARLYRDALAR